MKAFLEPLAEFEFIEFESDAKCKKSLSRSKREIDIVLANWELSSLNRDIVEMLRSYEATRGSLVIMVASPEDYHWMKGAFRRGGGVRRGL